MSVRPHPKKGPGYWIIDYYPAGRKGKRVRFVYEGTEGKALAMEQDVRRNPGELSDVVVPLVKDLIPGWLDFYKNEVAPRTYDDAITCIANWLPHFGMFRPANVSKQSINNYKSARILDIANKAAVGRGQPPRYVKKRTVNKELSYLSVMLKWAASAGHCDDLTFQIRGFPAKQTTSPTPTVLTPRQITKMYECCDPEYKLLFLLMSDMALRVDEAKKVIAEDVDEYHETLVVIGKGNKERSLPWVSDRFAYELGKTLDERPSGLLTLSKTTGQKLTDPRSLINRAAKKAGITKKINPHLLRHSGLTSLAQQGMSPHALQQFAGHSSMMTTQRIYIHIRSDFVGDEVRKIRGK